jgi:hypothetical protein
MVNYSNGKIYKIEPLNGEEGDIYVGSTTKKLLSQRMTKHRSDYICWKNDKGTKTTSFDLFDKYGIDNCKIILLELVNAQSKDELISHEAFFIRSLNCVNRNIPDRTKKEYYEDTKEKNKNKIKEKKKEYYEDNKDKIKENYENNKEKIKEYRKLEYRCDCGSLCKLRSKAEHFRSKKHLKFISIKIGSLEGPL